MTDGKDQIKSMDVTVLKSQIQLKDSHNKSEFNGKKSHPRYNTIDNFNEPKVTNKFDG